MNYREYASIVMEEATRCLNSVHPESVDLLVERIAGARRVFCDGTGRSGLQSRGFAMRLGHLGIPAYVVSETTTPPIAKGDLLLICSASGASAGLAAHAAKARSLEAEVVLITAAEHTPIHKDSSQSVMIHAGTKLQRQRPSVQPMGTLFEQSLSLFLDTVVLLLMERLGMDNDSMYGNHTNLE